MATGQSTSTCCPRHGCVCRAAHALLLVSGVWPHYALPVPVQRQQRASLGWNNLDRFLDLSQIALRSDIPVGSVEPLNLLKPEAVLEVANAIRLVSQHLARTAPPQVFQTTDDLVGKLAVGYDNMIQDYALRSKRFFASEYLLQCLIFAGLLKSTRDLHSALSFAVRLSVPHEHERQHLLNLLNGPHQPPSTDDVPKQAHARDRVQRILGRTLAQTARLWPSGSFHHSGRVAAGRMGLGADGPYHRERDRAQVNLLACLPP